MNGLYNPQMLYGYTDLPQMNSLQNQYNGCAPTVLTPAVVKTEPNNELLLLIEEGE